MYLRTIPPIIRKAIAAVALIMVPLSLVGVHLLLQGEFEDVRTLRATAEQTIDTRERLSRLLTLHLDAETGVRGYVLTGDRQFLEHYERALARRDVLIAQMQRYDDPTFRADLSELVIRSNAKLANDALNVADVEQGMAERARERIVSGRGRALMDAIRTDIAAMDAAESARLSVLTRAGTATNDIERAVNLLLIGLTVLLALVAVVVARSIRQRRRALLRAELLAKRQKVMFDGAVDGFLWLDDQGRILRINPSICRMFGYDEHDLIGQHNMFLMKEKFSMEQSLAWLRTVGEAGVHGAGKRFEFIGKRADGSIFETEIAISRVEGDFEGTGEDTPRYIASIRDISDRKRIERMKTEFVSTVSHELRTPLTSIGGSLGLVLGGATGPLTDKTRRLIDIAHANCERLVRLINDILDIEKIESGKMEFDIRRMQVAPLVRRTQEAMAGFAEKHGVKLEVALPPWPQCIMGDPDRLDQLLTNLVSNAIKHAPAGSSVELACNQRGGFARIEVRDRGAGVPMSFRDRIFGKFAMADASDSRAKGGTGLGLSISREIARRHSGEIGFADRDGGGTVFHVDLPLIEEHAAPNGTDIDRTKPAILHLDDDFDFLSVVASAFGENFQMLSATSLSEAREMIAGLRLQAAIVDIGLGPEDGLELVRELRGAHPDLPIVLFTAIDDATDDGNADRVLIKSRTSVEEMVAEVKSLIGRRKRDAA